MWICRQWSVCLLGFIVMLGIAGCSSSEEVVEPGYVERPVHELYNEAMAQLNNEDYEIAKEAFEELERQHPYSVWATKGQLMAAYAAYLDNEYDDAIAVIDRFIQLHPGHRDVAYAHYLKGLSYYEQITDVGRDQAVTLKAAKAFRELVARFPDSRYSREARLKIDLTEDHLAGKEMEIGRFYQKRQLWLAALKRFQSVVANYQTTTHVAEALHRLTEVYLALGLNREAQASAAFLGYNYPGSGWYEDTFELLRQRDMKPESDEGSWIGRLFGAS